MFWPKRNYSVVVFLLATLNGLIYGRQTSKLATCLGARAGKLNEGKVAVAMKNLC